MAIKGWRKLSDLKYQSIIQPNQTVRVTKKDLHTSPYEGWGARWYTGHRNEIIVPRYPPTGRGIEQWVELSKKEALSAAFDWMRKHPRGG